MSTTVYETKYEMGKATFDFQMKIAKLQLKLNPTTLSDVREQRH